MGLKESYNKIAKDWDKDHQSDSWWIEGTDYFCSLFKPGDSLVDVGCGSGVKAEYLTNKGLQVTGIDISENMIELSQRRVPRAEFLVLGMEDVYSLEEEFHGVFAQASLLHVPKKKALQVVGEFAKVTKPEGFVYIAVKEKRENGPDEEVKKENDYGYEYERFFSYFTPEEIIYYMQSNNLEVVYQDVRASGKTNWIQAIGKKS